jgi:lipopolysaccharide biosynthesis regulator YciM
MAKEDHSDAGNELAQYADILNAMASAAVKRYKHTSAQHIVHRYRRTYIDMVYHLRVAQGEYDHAEQAFTELFNTMQSENERVTTQLHLGTLYAQLGQIDKANEAFHYVISRGNKLHAVTHAKRQLCA